jgi:substrate-binding family protein
VPTERRALADRLVSRWALTDPDGARHLKRSVARPVERPWASVFRIGVLMPDSGDYAGDGAALEAGLSAGFASEIPRSGPRPELERFPTGDEAPPRAAAAFEWAVSRCGLVCGGLLDASALMFATGAHLTRVPLLLPGITNDANGTVGPEVAQLGPSGEARGRALAEAALAKRPTRVGIVASSASFGGAFQRGFERACEQRGIPVVVRRSYGVASAGAPRGTPTFAEEVRALALGRVDLLFWDGEPREAVALLRQLGRERMSLRVCGGEGLSPARHHRESRVWLEGVQYVAEDWQLASPDSADLAARIGETPVAAHVRGYLAGRVLATLVGPDALAPEEVTARLRARVTPDSTGASRRFLDLGAERAWLPVYRVAAGRALRAQ